MAGSTGQAGPIELTHAVVAVMRDLTPTKRLIGLNL
jgi:hypothetical protein